MKLSEVIEKIMATKTKAESDSVVDELNAANACSFFTTAQNVYIQSVIDEHLQHIKNPCYEG